MSVSYQFYNLWHFHPFPSPDFSMYLPFYCLLSMMPLPFTILNLWYPSHLAIPTVMASKLYVIFVFFGIICIIMADMLKISINFFFKWTKFRKAFFCKRGAHDFIISNENKIWLTYSQWLIPWFASVFDSIRITLKL